MQYLGYAPGNVHGRFGAQPAALLTIALPRTADEVDSTLIGSMFDLTPAEVHLAQALMTGEGMARIAAAQRISITTVRSQLKSIFSKTDTHRQAELVELLMRLTAL